MLLITTELLRSERSVGFVRVARAALTRLQQLEHGSGGKTTNSFNSFVQRRRPRVPLAKKKGRVLQRHLRGLLRVQVASYMRLLREANDADKRPKVE